MGGFISGVVNTAKSVWNSVKSFFTFSSENSGHYNQNSAQKNYQGANTIKEYLITKINGNISKILAVTALVAAPVIGAILGSFKLGLLIGIGLFISIHLTRKIIFSKPEIKVPKVEDNPDQKDDPKVDKKEQRINNLNPEIKRPNFDNELKRKALDHSKDFLEDVKSYIKEIEEFKRLDNYPKKKYLYQFTLDGVNSIKIRKKDDVALKKGENGEEIKKDDENENIFNNNENKININNNINNNQNNINNNVNNNENNINNNEIDNDYNINNNENNNININENNSENNNEINKENNINDNENNNINNNENNNKIIINNNENNININENNNENNINNNRNNNEKDEEDFKEKENIKKSVLVSKVYFRYNRHNFDLKFKNEISKEKIGRKIMEIHINNLKTYLDGEYEVTFNEFADENLVFDDINKIKNFKRVNVVLTKKEN